MTFTLRIPNSVDLRDALGKTYTAYCINVDPEGVSIGRMPPQQPERAKL